MTVPYLAQKAAWRVGAQDIAQTADTQLWPKIDDRTPAKASIDAYKTAKKKRSPWGSNPQPIRR